MSRGVGTCMCSSHSKSLGAEFSELFRFRKLVTHLLHGWVFGYGMCSHGTCFGVSIGVSWTSIYTYIYTYSATSASQSHFWLSAGRCSDLNRYRQSACSTGVFLLGSALFVRSRVVLQLVVCRIKVSRPSVNDRVADSHCISLDQCQPN